MDPFQNQQYYSIQQMQQMQQLQQHQQQQQQQQQQLQQQQQHGMYAQQGMRPQQQHQGYGVPGMVGHHAGHVMPAQQQQHVMPAQQQQHAMPAQQGMAMQQQPMQAQQQPRAAPVQDDDWDIDQISSGGEDDTAPLAPPGPPQQAASTPSQLPGQVQPHAPAQLQPMVQQHHPHLQQHLQQQQQQRAQVLQPPPQQQHQRSLTPPNVGQPPVNFQNTQMAALARAQSAHNAQQGLGGRHMSSITPQGRPNLQSAVSQSLDAQKLLQQQQAQALDRHKQQQKAPAAQSAAKSGSEGAAAKRQKASEQLPPAPDDAVPLYEVLYKASKAGVNLQASSTAPAAAAAAAGAAAGAAGAVSAAEGPSTSIEDILRRAEYAGRAVPDSVAARGRGGSDEEQLLPDSALKRLMELQGLNKAFRLQPDVMEHLQRLTDSFVTEAAKFGVELASHRRGATLRPSDLATYLERTHHLHVPGFLKEYHPYRRPAASDLHRERTIMVRKAQLAAGQAAGEGGAAAAAGGGRGRGAAAGGD